LSSRRLPSGGRIDRSRTLRFAFDGRVYQGLPGDTLASALLAHDVALVGRSFKYHRPRGILSAGPEEPNALVELRTQARREPNTRATQVELYEGLQATSQNRWPTLALDARAVNGWFAPLLGAGFYYKTFMWPARFWERVYEPLIRRAAGLGRASGMPDPDDYEKCTLHADVLVVGSGPAGLAAARAVALGGARVVLCEQDFALGGRLLGEPVPGHGRGAGAAVPEGALRIDGQVAGAWAEQVEAELRALPEVTLLARTTVFGAYDHGQYAAVERVWDHVPEPAPFEPRQRLWRIVARRCVLATGALERPLVFADNDRPGVMLAASARTYVNRFAVKPGQSAVVFTNNDDGWRTARDMASAGIEVDAVVEVRSADEIGAMRGSVGDIPVFTNARVTGVDGRKAVKTVHVRTSAGKPVSFEADIVAVSGGWNPVVHLTCHRRNNPVWNDTIAAFVPGAELPHGMAVVGAANGAFSTHAALSQATQAAGRALSDLGFSGSSHATPEAPDAPYEIKPFWHVADSKRRAWLDLQNDVTVKDVVQSEKEGFRSVEHMKRYTTLGMATDQGKTSNVNALAVMAELTGKSIPQTGTTIFRPPYTPVAISAFAGRLAGKEYRPFRLPPSHDWAVEQKASFTEAGLWLRAEWYALKGEKGWRDSVDREALTVRRAVGMCDVSTLGKIDVKGRDAATFLDRIYTNTMSTVPVGRVRYGLMLREDGFAFDDGTAARLGENHYVVTTTTANAGLVMQHMDYCHQVHWPELDVHMVSVTDKWAQFSVAGPHARDVMRRIVDEEFDISNEAFPYMACRDLTVCGGVEARLFRISFSGELAYEVAVPARYGDSLARAIHQAGKQYGIEPYGLEALNVLRIEKGHLTGAEINGQTSAADLGMGKMMSTKKDFIGRAMAERPAFVDPDRPTLAGFKALKVEDQLSAGAHFIGIGKEANTANDEGYMTSVCWSPHLGCWIGLGYIRRGPQRHGEKVRAVDQVRGTDIEVEICSPHFIDPQGERLRA